LVRVTRADGAVVQLIIKLPRFHNQVSPVKPSPTGTVGTTLKTG
jgi:hypothetical protein